jgi:hypothetical protein
MTATRLFGGGGGPIAARMNTRFPCFLTLALLLALPAAAETKKPAPTTHPTPAGPKSIGKFEDWTAATNAEAGQTVCYAFTRVQTSVPTLPGRGPVVLTVTERSSGRDAVAIDAGFPYAPKATVTVQVNQTGLDFYTDVSRPHDAFALDGKAVVAAFGKGSRAIARSPAPKEVTDTFSLKGFADAYKAIVKACPAK